MLSQTRNSRISNGLTSTSLERAPGPSKSFVRGKSGYVPFWPGGLDDVLMDPEDENNLNGRHKGLRTVPPGFTRGLRLPGDESQDDSLVELDEVYVTNHVEGVRCSILQQVEI
jgi:antiviral helicase SKI2